MPSVIHLMPELQGLEMNFVQSLLNEMTESQAQLFVSIYRARRVDPQTILLTTLLGFFIIAGVQRFLLGQIGMGLLYLFTGGLCLVGTIIDLVNYQKLAFEKNQNVALEIATIAKGQVEV